MVLLYALRESDLSLVELLVLITHNKITANNNFISSLLEGILAFKAVSYFNINLIFILVISLYVYVGITNKIIRKVPYTLILNIIEIINLNQVNY